jgi:hypothetical protein
VASETHPNTKAYVKWMILTHNGRRLPGDVCSHCGRAMTEAQVAEYLQQYRPEEPLVDHIEARQAYLEATEG